ncbi:MAG: hypothetical protein AAGA67_02020 [Cyanobacteria bacterium P01_F01_bin.153]
MALVLGIMAIGWVAASIIGTQAYFRGEQRKPIHNRNWNSDSFDQMANAITGTPTDYGDREPAQSFDPFHSAQLSQ